MCDHQFYNFWRNICETFHFFRTIIIQAKTNMDGTKRKMNTDSDETIFDPLTFVYHRDFVFKCHLYNEFLGLNLWERGRRGLQAHVSHAISNEYSRRGRNEIKLNFVGFLFIWRHTNEMNLGLRCNSITHTHARACSYIFSQKLVIHKISHIVRVS